MILFELTNTEAHPVYRALEVENGSRQYDFLRSIVAASLRMGRPFLSQHVIKALNFQAITCLHLNAGEYRPCGVEVGAHRPMAHYRVAAAMDDFVNRVNRGWDQYDPVVLATYVLWRLNNIHPFINGNGRTARAACYFVLCLAAGKWLPGATTLPELIKRERDEYCDALQHAHETFERVGEPDLGHLHAIVTRLLNKQLSSEIENESVSPETGAAAAEPSPRE